MAAGAGHLVGEVEAAQGVVDVHVHPRVVEHQVRLEPVQHAARGAGDPSSA